MRLGASKRFPLSMKHMAEKYPQTTTVQARFITPAGTVVEFEGALLSEAFEQTLAAAKATARRREP